MIKQCERCGCDFNNETVSKCPLCNINKIDKKLKAMKKRKEKNKDRRFSGIMGFINDDTKDKRRTATGYSHKTKTGGKSL